MITPTQQRWRLSSLLVLALAATTAASPAPSPWTPVEPTPAPVAPAPPAPTPPVPAPPAKPEAGLPPQNLEPIEPDVATSVLGKSVEGAAGENMGRVVDILVDVDGQPRAAVIDFGGFLGVGNRKIAVAWRLLQFRPTDKKAPIRLGVTRAEVQAAPEYKEKIDPAQVVAPPTEAPPAAVPAPAAAPPSAPK